MLTATENNTTPYLPRPQGKPWTITELADFLSSSRRHIENLVAAKKIKIIRLGGKVLVPDAEACRLASEGL
jgi:excisionase family DNA binding protein